MKRVKWVKKSLLAGLLAVGLAAAGTGLNWRGIVPEVRFSLHWLSVEERIVSSTVMLADVDGGGASGVLVKYEGKWYCWTAAHVARHVTERMIVTVRFFDQGVIDTRTQGKVVKIVAQDDTKDLALLELALPDIGQVSAEVSRDSLRLGQEVINCGHALLDTWPWSLTKGCISQAPGESNAGLLVNGDYLGVSTSSYPGCSGSGIWTTSGKLVGILSWGSGPGLIGFVHNDVMVKFAIDNKIEWAL